MCTFPLYSSSTRSRCVVARASAMPFRLSGLSQCEAVTRSGARCSITSASSLRDASQRLVSEAWFGSGDSEHNVLIHEALDRSLVRRRSQCVAVAQCVAAASSASPQRPQPAAQASSAGSCARSQAGLNLLAVAPTGSPWVPGSPAPNSSAGQQRRQASSASANALACARSARSDSGTALIKWRRSGGAA